MFIHYHLFVESLYMFLTVQFIFGCSLRYWRKLYNYFSHWISGWLWSFQSIVTGMILTFHFQDPTTPRPHLLKGDNNILNPSLEWKCNYWKKINLLMKTYGIWWNALSVQVIPCCLETQTSHLSPSSTPYFY